MLKELTSNFLWHNFFSLHCKCISKSTDLKLIIVLIIVVIFLFQMLVYWRKYEKVEKEHRKRAEKEAQEQRKLDDEFREVSVIARFFKQG